MRIKTIIVLLMLISVFFAGCIGDDEPVIEENISVVEEIPEEVEETPVEETEVVEDIPAVEPRTYTIRLEYYQARPSILEINRGDTVVWRNHQDRRFTIISEDELWNDYNIVPGRSLVYTFNKSGTYNFSESGLPRMSGSIIVN
ncbi:MAG: hypothetical protein K0A90_02205 [Methanosarcinaceae archaeon]|nr:hypothetical protein [Methanosarcinaceae archaeon]